MNKKRVKLNEKIKYIKRVFQTPYHFFYITGSKSNLVAVRFEDKQGRHFEFTSSSMFAVVLEAEKYVVDEIKSGQFADPDIKKEKNEDENK